MTRKLITCAKIFLVAAICLCCLEIFARCYYYVFLKGFRSTSISVPSGIEGLYLYKPNSREVIDGRLIEINSYGFRDTEFPLRKNGKRIVMMGDSVTAGLAVDPDKTFPGIVERRTGCEVINAGHSGFNTLQELLLLERRVLPLKPDLILLAVCLNDYATTEDHVEKFRRGDKMYWKQKHQVGALQPLYDRSAFFRMAYNRGRRIYYALAGRQENPWMVTLPRPAKAERERWEQWFLDFDALCRKNGVPVVYVILPTRTIMGDEQSDPELAKFFKEHDMVYLDMISPMSGYEADELFIKDDTLHLTEFGHGVVGEALSGYLQRSGRC